MNIFKSINTFSLNEIATSVSTLYIISIVLFAYSPALVIYSHAIFLVLLANVLLIVLKEKKIPMSNMYILLLLFLTWSMISSFWAIDYDSHIRKLLTLVQLALLSIMYFIIYTKDGTLEKFIRSFLIAGYIMCIYALYVYGGWTSFIVMMSNDRLGTEINQANVFGYFASMTVIFSYYNALYNEKYIYYILLCLPFIMALSSGSRKVIVIIIMGIVLLTYLKNRSRKLGKSILYLLIVCVLIYAVLQMPVFSIATTRFESLLNVFSSSEKIDSSTRIRESFIRIGIDLFKERPLTGYGLDSFTYITQWTYSHNNYVEVVVNGGIVSLIFFYLIRLYPIINLFNKTLRFNAISTLLFVLLLLGLIHDIGTVTYYSKFQYILFGVYFAKVYQNEILENNIKQEKMSSS